MIIGLAAGVGFEPTGLLHHKRFQVYALMTTWAPSHLAPQIGLEPT